MKLFVTLYLGKVGLVLTLLFMKNTTAKMTLPVQTMTKIREVLKIKTKKG